MNDANLIETAEQVTDLPVGQWVIAADGHTYCLVGTHLGWPQRMWMSPGGDGHTGIEHIPYPLRLADLDESAGVCPHSWGTQERGHCKCCGRVVSESRPMYFIGGA